jgi:putative hydrolase of the HAD superfamily
MAVNRLKAVLFDIDDTLFSTSDFARRARANAVRAMIQAGLDVPEQVVQRELDEVLAEFSSNYEHHFERLLQRLPPEATKRVNPALIVAAGVAAYHDTKFRELAPYPDVLPLLAGLARAGLRVGVITHGLTVKQAEKLVRLGVVPYLDPKAIFISDQIGISKPNPKLYAAALRELGLVPDEVMYVGDNPDHDIVPPKSIGMVTVWARRGSKKGTQKPAVAPDYVVDDFIELEAILRERFAVDLPGPGAVRN